MLGNGSVTGEYITMAKTHLYIIYIIYGITQLENLLTKVSNVIIQ